MGLRRSSGILLLASLGFLHPSLSEAGTLTLAWDRNTEPDLRGYVIRYGTQSGKYTKSVNVGNRTSWQLTNLQDGVRHYFVVHAVSSSGLMSGPSAQVSGFPSTTSTSAGGGSSPSLAGVRSPSDLDGDGRSEIAVWRPDPGFWYVLPSSRGYARSAYWAIQWGSGEVGDVPLVGDFDGDGRSDIAVWRPSTGVWYILLSSRGYARTAHWAIQWGGVGDVPVVGDVDGDGRSDITVWRPSTGVWYILRSSRNYARTAHWAIQWGGVGDVPVVGDFDGDGRNDIAVWRPSNGVWYILRSSQGYARSAHWAIQWGAGHLGDVPVAGDFDGDGRTDLAVWRPGDGRWWVRTSSTRYQKSFTVQWGAGAHGDIPLVRAGSAVQR